MKADINTIEINGVEYAPIDALPQIEKVPDTPIGQYAIVRCRDAGVWAGTVKQQSGREVTVLNARRLWYWKAKKGHTLSAVANYGLVEAKMPASVPVVYLLDACEVLPCTTAAKTSIVKQDHYNE